jgi:hypothetical protein
MGKFIDLTGMNFGKLTVIQYAGKNKWGQSLWICTCSCGNKEEIIKMSGCLKNGNTNSCGCLRNERSFLANKKYNEYDLSGDYGIGITSNGINFYFDKEDFELIKYYYWYAKKNNYIVTEWRETSLLLHRLIMNFQNSSNMDIDHKNKHPEDNRKENLRFCTHTENNRNKSMNKNNKTGISGVYWRKDSNNYSSYITINRKRKSLGSFENIEDAIIARLQAEAYYFSNFAPQSHLFEQYGIIP